MKNVDENQELLMGWPMKNIQSIAAGGGFRVTVKGQHEPLPVAVFGLVEGRVIPFVINPVGNTDELIPAELVDEHHGITILPPE